MIRFDIFRVASNWNGCIAGCSFDEFFFFSFFFNFEPQLVQFASLWNISYWIIRLMNVCSDFTAFYLQRIFIWYLWFAKKEKLLLVQKSSLPRTENTQLCHSDCKIAQLFTLNWNWMRFCYSIQVIAMTISTHSLHCVFLLVFFSIQARTFCIVCCVQSGSIRFYHFADVKYM